MTTSEFSQWFIEEKHILMRNFIPRIIIYYLLNKSEVFQVSKKLQFLPSKMNKKKKIYILKEEEIFHFPRLDSATDKI